MQYTKPLRAQSPGCHRQDMENTGNGKEQSSPQGKPIQGIPQTRITQIIRLS